MEMIGKVNNYHCDDCDQSHTTINLNAGTTPFGTTCPHCAKLNAFSKVYILPYNSWFTNKWLIINWCWYRPTRENLCKIEDDEIVRHILRGGLVKGKLGEVTPALDQVDPSWKFIQYADWCEKFYGQRPELENPWFPIDRKKIK